MIDLSNNFECDWHIELFDNKLSTINNELSDNNLTSELVGKRSFFRPITVEKFVIFVINSDETWVFNQSERAEGPFLIMWCKCDVSCVVFTPR